MNVAILDYGVGNLHSLAKAIARNGVSVEATPDVARALEADALVLPGVGSFGAAAAAIAPERERLRRQLEDGQPCLGICLGMQLLFEASDEGAGDGIGLIPGRVRRIAATRLPHMGWNVVEPSADPLFAGFDRLHAYYANSYVGEAADPGRVIAWSRCENDRFAAAVRSRRTWGVQFHPEKSGSAGLRVIENFLEQAR